MPAPCSEAEGGQARLTDWLNTPARSGSKNDSGVGASGDPQDFVIRESRAVYNSDNTAESCVLSGENTVFWANDS